MARFGLADQEHQRLARKELRMARNDLRDVRKMLAKGNCAGALGVFTFASIAYGIGLGHAHSSSKGVKTGQGRAIQSLRHKIVACFNRPR